MRLATISLLVFMLTLTSCQMFQQGDATKYVKAGNDVYMTAVSTMMDLIKAGLIDKEAALMFVEIRDIAHALLTSAEKTIAEGGEPDLSELRGALDALADFVAKFASERGGG